MRDLQSDDLAVEIHDLSVDFKSGIFHYFCDNMRGLIHFVPIFSRLACMKAAIRKVKVANIFDDVLDFRHECFTFNCEPTQYTELAIGLTFK